MNEEELLESLLEEGFVPADAPPTPPNEDCFFNVDSVTGNVGIGTADPVGSAFHIVADKPYPAIRLAQQGFGDVLLIDDKTLANQNDEPRTPYVNIKNDGKIGIGTTLPLSEIHLITDDKNSNILIGDLPDTRLSTDAGISFSGLANTVTSGLFTEVDGELISIGINASQAGIVDTSRVGGVIRLDTRKSGPLGDFNSFTVKGIGIGETIGDEYSVYTANLDTGDTFIAPTRGDVFVAAYSTETSLGIATDTVIPYYRFYNNGNAGIAGTLTLPDRSEITLGISSDLTLYHDPLTQNSYIIEDNPTGSLVIAGNNIEFRDTSLSELYAQFTTNSGVELFYNNEKRLETVGAGISIFSGLGGASNVATIYGPSEIIIDPAPILDNVGFVRIKGDLYVDGRQTIIESTVVTIADIQIGIGTSVSLDNALLDTGGITIGLGTIQKSFTYNLASDSLKSSENIDLGIGKTYRINGEDVLSATTLGSGVTDSSLTNVDTLIDLEVIGVTSIGVPGRSLLTDNFTVYLPSEFTGVTTFTNNVTIGEVAVPLEQLTVNSISTFTNGLTAKNITIQGTNGIPVAPGVGILTVAAINLPVGTRPVADAGYGNEGYALVSTGTTVYNNTGIGLSWVEIDTDTEIINFENPSLAPTVNYKITSVDDSVAVPNGFATAFYTSSLEYNHNRQILRDNIGNFRAIPQGPSNISIGNTFVGKHVINTADIVQFENSVFEVGDAVTVVNRNLLGNAGVGWTAGPAGPGAYIIAGIPGNLTRSDFTMLQNSIATFLCISNDGGTTTFIVAGVGIF
jgi:hypothetical protein